MSEFAVFDLRNLFSKMVSMRAIHDNAAGGTGIAHGGELMKAVTRKVVMHPRCALTAPLLGPWELN